MAWTIFVIGLKLLYRRLGIMLVGNVLWLLGTLLVVTWPAATAGLFFLAHRVVEEERARDPHYARVGDFWEGARRYLWPATRLALLDALAGIALGVALVFYWSSPVEPLRWLVGPIGLLFAAWVSIQMYLFPLLIISPETPPRHLALRALMTAFATPLDTTLLIFWLLILATLSLALAGPALLVLFSAVALVQTMALRVARINTGEIESPAPDE